MFRLMTSKANYANSYTFDLTTASSEDTGSLLALFEAHGLQHFFRVVGRSFIENCVLDHNEQLIIASAKMSGQGIVLCLRDDAFAHHLPEFFLGDPEFFFVVTDNAGVLFLNRHVRTQTPKNDSSE